MGANYLAKRVLSDKPELLEPPKKPREAPFSVTKAVTGAFTENQLELFEREARKPWLSIGDLRRAVESEAGVAVRVDSDTNNRPHCSRVIVIRKEGFFVYNTKGQLIPFDGVRTVRVPTVGRFAYSFSFGFHTANAPASVYVG